MKQLVRIVTKRIHHADGRDADELPVKPISRVVVCGYSSWKELFPYSSMLEKVAPHVIYHASDACDVSIFQYSRAY